MKLLVSWVGGGGEGEGLERSGGRSAFLSYFDLSYFVNDGE